MRTTNKEMEIIKNNIESFKKIIDVRKAYQEIENKILTYQQENDSDMPYINEAEEGDCYFYEFPAERLLTSILEKEDSFLIILNHAATRDYELYIDEYNISIPMKFLLTENFNWEQVYIEINSMEYADGPDTLEIEVKLPKGKQVIEDI